jgi:hypothetical protein
VIQQIQLPQLPLYHLVSEFARDPLYPSIVVKVLLDCHQVDQCIIILRAIPDEVPNLIEMPIKILTAHHDLSGSLA